MKGWLTGTKIQLDRRDYSIVGRLKTRREDIEFPI
jgi:hypothetical protein